MHGCVRRMKGRIANYLLGLMIGLLRGRASDILSNWISSARGLRLGTTRYRFAFSSRIVLSNLFGPRSMDLGLTLRCHSFVHIPFLPNITRRFFLHSPPFLRCELFGCQ